MINTKVIAHRGFSSLAPENTLASLSLAAEAGVKWVEIDAITCGDGTVVMWHDNSVDRCSDGTGAMSEHNRQSIKALNCGQWFSPEYSQERMATIEQAIDHIQQLGLGLNLEFKLYNNSPAIVVAPVLAYLNKHWKDFDKLIISSFDQEALEYCYAANPALKLGQLYEKIPDNWLAQMQNINAYSCHCNYKYIEQAQLTALKEQGYIVFCYTANEAEATEELWKWGLDAIITDYPQRFTDKLDKVSQQALSNVMSRFEHSTTIDSNINHL